MLLKLKMKRENLKRIIFQRNCIAIVLLQKRMAFNGCMKLRMGSFIYLDRKILMICSM